MPNIRQANDVEGFGVVMLEAGICGLPTVASNLEGIRDVITPGANGFLVSSEDREEFVSRILQCMATPLPGSQVLDFTRRFEWPAIVDRLVGCVQQLKDQQGVFENNPERITASKMAGSCVPGSDFPIPHKG
jgi:phosphatidylinositol alpha-1,6-mannosyltransferase